MQVLICLPKVHDAGALLVLATANVAELVPAAARHVIAALVLLHPEVASGALLRANFSRPLDELVILRQLVVVHVVGIALELGLAHLFLDFLAGLLHVVYNFAFKTVFDLALGTVKVRLVLLLLEEEIVAILTRAFKHARVLIADLLPFKLLTLTELR